MSDIKTATLVRRGQFVTSAFAISIALAACSGGAETEVVEVEEVGPPHVVAASQVEAGRYLLEGCNDCHTAGYPESGGTVPDDQRFLGNALAFAGPWGVSYPDNLRLTVANMNEDDWLNLIATREYAPPMPGWALKAWSDEDKLAAFAYLKALGPDGEEMPDPTPPGGTPEMPYVDMTPRMPDGSPVPMPEMPVPEPEAPAEG